MRGVFSFEHERSAARALGASSQNIGTFRQFRMRSKQHIDVDITLNGGVRLWLYSFFSFGWGFPLPPLSVQPREAGAA
jgi:hypothetical protein